jgi:hypothetical protein
VPGTKVPRPGHGRSPFLPQSAVTFGALTEPACHPDETDMFNHIVRIAFNDRLVRAAHWTVFSVGALSLSFAIIATAASAL